MGKRERGGRWVENPEDIGEVSDPNFVRLPDPRSLFAFRADRMRSLAAGNPLGDYLTFLAALASAQHALATGLPDPPAFAPDLLATRIGAAVPPLAPDLLGDESGRFNVLLTGLLDGVELAAAPEAARHACAQVGRMPWPERLQTAEAIFTGSYPAEHLAETVFIASALQVFLASHAAALPANRLKAVGDGVCPACGSAPVASMIVSWPSASRVRYCACSLCQTLWNSVRIKCTSCGSTKQIAYYSSEQLPATVAVETCGVCRCYIKHFGRHQDPALDPVADDIASFGLDVKIREDGFRPGGINPLMISG
ncbi:MAG: formate dehydrogenase accessory protein FdhE [Acetobacteraceae bacterium]|nr:formate dehydrogenase accessory protein FdhE [Acetobacteraceae bacterium]